MRRVVVTGIGAVTPLGNTFNASWKNLVDGVSGISMIDRFNVSDVRYKFAGQIRDLKFDDHLTQKEQKRYDRFVQYAYIAARQAIEDARLTDVEYKDDIGVVIGSSRAGISSLDRSIREQTGKGRKRISSYLMPSTTTSIAVSFIGQKYGFTGESEGISSACASGLVAIGNALRLVRHGIANKVIAGGAEAPICRVCIEGYGNSGALSKRDGKDASSPFDLHRDGFVLSEGACIMILEEYESAHKRGAKIYGEIMGYAAGMDAYHQTKPWVEGEEKTIKKALKNSGIKKDSIGFVSTHAPSTQLGDRAEADALKSVFGDVINNVPVSAFKSATGHMLAASGAFESAATLRVLQEGIVPPTINLKEKDPACDLNVVTLEREIDAEYATVNSFGFGGVNAVLVLKKV